MGIFDRKPLFTVSTPWPRVPRATLLSDVWNDHIVKGHVEMSGREEDVRTIVTTPTAVLSGTTNREYVIYVSQAVTTPGGTPIGVVIDPEEQIIVTAYPNRSLKLVIPQERILWLPSGTK
jgi:hypothetical protein